MADFPSRSLDRPQQEHYRSQVRGCLLGGAIGDALGNPIEFLRTEQIIQRYGENGLTDLVTNADGVAEITDDTQMTLFTCEGLIRASVRWDRGICHPPSVVHRAYMRWLATQELPGPPERPESWLAAQPFLYARRAPGNACLSGLRGGRMGTPESPANPQSKGCGAVMRSAPFGLQRTRRPEDAFALAVECAVQTHGHPTGYLAAGAFAAMIRLLLDDVSVGAAVDGAIELLRTQKDHDETLAALRAAVDAAVSGATPAPETVERLGGGWIAEEALAIGVYAALVHEAPEDVRRALLLSVNHSGDSDSTGAICGNLLGARHGETALPPDWVFLLEGRGVLLEAADDFTLEFTQGRQLHGDYGPMTAWRHRYPGG